MMAHMSLETCRQIDRNGAMYGYVGLCGPMLCMERNVVFLVQYLLKTELRISDFQNFHWLCRTQAISS